MTENKGIILVLCALLVFSGCGYVPVVSVLETPEAVKMMENRSQDPIPGRVMVAFVDTSSYGEMFSTMLEDVKHTWVPEFDVERETEEFHQLFKKTGVFKEVKKSKLIPAETTRENALSEAWNRGFDFVLFPRLEHYTVSYSGHTGSHIGNIFLWFTLWVPSWFVHDEIFSTTVQLEMCLIDVYSQQDIIRKSYAESLEKRLSLLQRGWQIFGIWKAPGGLGPENWKKISRRLVPEAVNSVKMQAVNDFKKGVIKTITEKDAFNRAARKTVVVSIGLGTYNDSKISPIPYAAEDASAFFSVLSKDNKARKGYSRLLTNGMAGKKDIMNTLGELGKRTRSSDVQIVYYSGYSASLQQEDGSVTPYLVPFDVIPERIGETCISFEELASVLRGSNAQEIYLILDTSFGGSVIGKTLKKEGAPDIKNAMDMFGKRVSVFIASGDNEPANVFSELKQSLFTYYLLESTVPENGDINRDGFITMKEIFLYSEGKVKMTSEFRGRSQTPRWLGSRECNAVIIGSDKETAREAVMNQLGADSKEQVELE